MADEFNADSPALLGGALGRYIQALAADVVRQLHTRGQGSEELETLLLQKTLSSLVLVSASMHVEHVRAYASTVIEATEDGYEQVQEACAQLAEDFLMSVPWNRLATAAESLQRARTPREAQAAIEHPSWAAARAGIAPSAPGVAATRTCIGCAHPEHQNAADGRCTRLDASGQPCGCLGGCPACGCKSVQAEALPPPARVCEVCRNVWRPRQ